jgi:signal transduction histidine kinase
MQRAEWLLAHPWRLAIVVAVVVVLPVIVLSELDAPVAVARGALVVLATVLLIGSVLFGAMARRALRQRGELRESLKQHEATLDVLDLIGRSALEIEPVFQAILDRAARLFSPPPWAIILRRDRDDLIVTALFPLENTGQGTRLTVGARITPDRRTGFGRAFLDGAVAHIPDPAADPEANPMDGTRLGVPIMRGGDVIGAIGLARTGVHPFTEAEIRMVQTFAAQAAIAIENARLVNEIRDKSRQLEVAGRHKSEFLANMSHELRTPLNAIIGFSDVLLQRMFGDLNRKQEEYVTDILDSGKHQLSLINDILDLSKVEAGRMELEVSEFSLGDVLTTALTLVRDQAVRRDIGLELVVDPGVTTIAADRRKVRQVVLNLLANAVRFTPDGGRVAVSARQGVDAVEVSVSDNGIGIAADEQVRIFEEFAQARARATTHDGTGLGLTLTQKFVALHGGRIWVDSAPGEGSTFTFTLPTNGS